MAEKEQKENQKSSIKHIVRVKNTDLKGDKKINIALQSIKGISFMMANAICQAANIDQTKKAGELSDDEIKNIEAVIENPVKYNIPKFLFNRKIDPETGESKHLFGTDVKYVMEQDIRLMKKIKSYKGVRHTLGLPVRGQRTKSNFRKNKGKPIAMKKRITVRK